MNLGNNDLRYIMRDFPNIKLSYEKTIHKKVSSANLFLTIPKGKKYFAWFRFFRNNAVCFFLELDRKKQNISSITIKVCCFDEILCINLGTILYGTLFRHNNIIFYNIEDIFYFKGESMINYNQQMKIKQLHILFLKYINQIVFGKKDVLFGLPIISNTRDQLVQQIKDLPYELYCIQHRFLKKHPTYLNEKINSQRQFKRIFLVKATIYDDIYTLYFKNKQLEKHHAPIITDYKTSVFMNKLFRNIKENRDLDKLEESDDEEEFENISEDKYVDLKKEYKILCVYIKKFKLWKPLQYLEEGVICEKNDILRIENNNRY